jgi:hypothetical protein
MALKPDSLMLNPGQVEYVDDEGLPTAEGADLMHELVSYARSLEGRFGQLREQMRLYEAWWRQSAVRNTFGTDAELTKGLPVFPNAKGRILIAKVVRANVKERVGFKISLDANWTEKENNAAQRLERYCHGALWMADQERAQRALDEIQSSLAWYGAARGCAIAVAFVRNSKRQKESDEYGDAEPYLVRTPDPMTCTWNEGSYGIDFYARVDARPLSDFYGLDYMQGVQPSGPGSKEENGETFDVWWADAERNVWNATVVSGSHFLVAPTNHTSRRGLSYLPVSIDAPRFGSPRESSVGDSDQYSLRDHYQGVLENNVNAYAVESYINATRMRNLQDFTNWAIAIASERNINVEELKLAFQGNTVLFLGKDGRVFPVQPPEISKTVTDFAVYLDGLQQMGGMPNTAIAGISTGMTGVALQEAILQGDLAAGPISDMLKRMHQGIVHCLLLQHRKLGRKIELRGQERQGGLFTEGVDAASLPPPSSYIISAIHEPALIRDDYRTAQTMLTQKSAGRSSAAIFDDFFPDPLRELRLADQEQLDALPGIKLAKLVDEARSKYGEDSTAFRYATALLAAHLTEQGMAPEGQARIVGGGTNGPAPGATMAAESMPQLPGGPASAVPAGVNPNDPTAQAMLGQLGAELGGTPNDY